MINIQTVVFYRSAQYDCSNDVTKKNTYMLVKRKTDLPILEGHGHFCSMGHLKKKLIDVNMKAQNLKSITFFF